MPTTSNARIANVSLFCEAHEAMDKIIERLLAMADEGATADQVTQLIAKDGTALLRELGRSEAAVRTKASDLNVSLKPTC